MSLSDEPRRLVYNILDLLISCPNAAMRNALCRVQAIGDLHGGREAYVRRLLRLQARVVAYVRSHSPPGLFSDEDADQDDDPNQTTRHRPDDDDDDDKDYELIQANEQKEHSNLL